MIKFQKLQPFCIVPQQPLAPASVSQFLFAEQFMLHCKIQTCNAIGYARCIKVQAGTAIDGVCCKQSPASCAFVAMKKAGSAAKNPVRSRQQT